MKVLVVDDDQFLRLNMRDQLERPYPPGSAAKQHQIFMAPDLDQAILMLDQEQIDVAFLDLNLGEGMKKEGIQLLRHIRHNHPKVVPIMITGVEDERVIDECFQLGAADYIMKPFEDRIVHQLMRKAISHQRIFRRFLALKVQAGDRAVEPVELTSKSPRFSKVIESARKLKGKRVFVYIAGETGVGKDMMARFLWTLEEDDARPFVAVDGGALPENLAESELFGCRKGAFSGATENRVGKFEAADGGDIFFDEITNMPVGTQSKLLRVLQDMKVSPLGSGKTPPREVDVRVISATNANIDEMMKTKAFRDDLFYRLNMFTLEIPPLRERMEDLDDLVALFLRKKDLSNKWLSDGAWKLCRNYSWPGNVRELENAITVAAELADGDEILVKDIEPNLRGVGSGKEIAGVKESACGAGEGPFGLGDAAIMGKFNALTEDFEKSLIDYAIKKAGSGAEAARYLGITRGKLNHKRRGWGLG